MYQVKVELKPSFEPWLSCYLHTLGLLGSANLTFNYNIPLIFYPHNTE